ncbi:conserved hypothetical protein [uncultured Desulfobacterium sp.]|uniref:Uncharacterized protein n=1 Tax=uncultured Desulfobacterium sp. TaxID=201089 RepID=A0A445MW13_9BACT|nr:conserved hypothetical protein [uncultured Desulfobacterium sp.]
MIEDFAQIDDTNGIIATIENKDNPSQVIAIKYLPDEQAFVTSGIRSNFDEKEILMPAHLVVINFELMGSIVSSILEKISLAQEMETTFEYAPCFEVMDRIYTLRDYGQYMKLYVEDD